MNKKMRVIMLLVFIQIFLLVSMSISQAYQINEIDKNNKINIVNGEGKWKNILSFVLKIIFSDKNLVSALTVGDLKDGGWTCIDSKDGSKCQEYIASECRSKCKDACLPTSSPNVESCKIGTCYDSTTGECNFRTPKITCESAGKNWYSDTSGNIAQCKRGCCQISGEFSFISEQECAYQSDLLGIKKTFRSDIKTEYACYSLRSEKVEGACVYGTATPEGKRQCKFTTRQDCQSNVKGVFYQNKLCSNPELNTICERMKTTGCSFGKDEVYWFDSCGNRENIWTAGVTGWNNGLLLKKENSCYLGNSMEPLLNADSCGNCNYAGGSICGSAGSGLTNAYKCVDLNCIDKNGNERLNGESWCEYQGSVGLDETITKAASRSTDTVGSRDFRRTCIRGEIITEPCGDYRNDLCIESKTDVGNGKKISNAACKLNTWQLCLDMNSDTSTKAKCEKNSDCFLKKVAVSDWIFDICVPRYAPGFLFDENGRGEGAEAICSTATQSCTKKEVKTLTKGWECKTGCDCDKSTFTEQMNNLCVSLGDCGAKANYLGDVSESYSISEAPTLSATYLANMQKYSYEEFFKSKYIKADGKITNYGTPSNAYPSNTWTYEAPVSNTAGMMVGGAGIALGYLASTGTSLGLGYVPTSIGCGAWATAAGTVLAGAAIGFALVTMLLDWTGVGGGISDELAYGLMAAGALGGAMAATAMSSSTAGIAGALGTTAAGVGWVPIIGWIIVIIVVLFIVILKLIGIGDIKEKTITFTCLPWEAKNGGDDCKKCGSDGFPCSAYACSSLGQTCEIINEDSDEPECIDAGRGDVVPPTITPWTTMIGKDHSYTNIRDTGFGLTGPSAGCLNPGTQVVFGLQLSEHGKCKYSMEHTKTYDSMPYNLGTSSLYRKNHTIIYTVPTLGDLGIVDSDRGDATMYVRCKDKKGNSNVNEYAIQFCIKKSVDMSAPMIISKLPAMEYLPYQVTKQNVSLGIDEYATCRWDYGDKDYNFMKNEMNCASTPGNSAAKGLCVGTFELSSVGNSTFYVRCKDHPEIGNTSVTEFTLSDGNILKYYSDEVDEAELKKENGGTMDNVTNVTINEAVISTVVVDGINLTQARNENQESRIFYLKETKSPLIIESAYPDGETIEAGVEPTTVQLKISTKDGVNNGEAICYYNYSDMSVMFEETGSALHLQDFTEIYSGGISIPIECKDAAENKVSKDVNFKVILDSDAPRVTRVYSTGSGISLITDEDANCYYSNSDCNYEITNGTLISGSSGKIHSFSYERGATYYIKCSDKYGWNPGSRCSAVVKANRVGGQ